MKKGCTTIRKDNRNFNLDFLKIIACIAVVGLHTLHGGLSSFNMALYFSCGFAVPAFFMSSGYMLLNRNRVTYSQVIKKIISIGQIVLLWSLLVFGYDLMLDIVKGKFGYASLLRYPYIAFMSLFQKGSLWHFWYLGALMIIYALLPLLLKFKNELLLIWTGCLVTGFLFQGISYILREPIQSHILQTLRVWTWLQYFILGGLLRKSEIKKSGGVSTYIHGICLMIVTGLLIIYQNHMGKSIIHNMHAEYFYDDPLTVIWVVLIFTFIMRLNLPGFATLIIKKISPITLGVYIIHPLLIKTENTFFVINTIPASLLFFLSILVISFCICLSMMRIPVINRLIVLK